MCYCAPMLLCTAGLFPLHRGPEITKDLQASVIQFASGASQRLACCEPLWYLSVQHAFHDTLV
jgi:hypothetical protein